MELAATVNDVMHRGYASSWAAGYALPAAAAGRRRAWWHGPAFGTVVWASDHVVLPPAEVYEPIWRYDVPTLAKDLSAHLTFGAVADGARRAV